MAIDARIAQAITDAVEEAGQRNELARRLTAWFEAVTSGIEDINDEATADRRLEILFDGTAVEGENGDGEN
ncbi:MAG: hypothetical protein OXC26_18915 [Albidovulum sp.]|nr:hypothetical protein [Albidovulum sp.]